MKLFKHADYNSLPKLNITVTANKPSEKALKNFGNIVNSVAEQYVNEKTRKKVA